MEAKGGWRLINTIGLWTHVITKKYLALDSLEESIRKPNKTHYVGSVIWKDMVNSFPVIEAQLAWNVGNGRHVRIGRILGMDLRNNIFFLLTL